MIFVSCTDACRRLGIDAKTLHRWLVEAQLSLSCHPVDGRKKGVSEQQLQMLARLHHRGLASCAQEEPPPPSSQLPALPDDLLQLPEQMTALQMQIAALQQQVAALTRLLTEPKPQPASPLPATSPTNTARPKVQPARARPTGAAKAKTPAKPVHVIPRVEYGEDGRYVVICPKKGLLPFEPDTPEWFAWVREQDSFRFVGKGGHFTAHHEWRVPKGAWRAYRHIRNRNYIQRLAPNHDTLHCRLRTSG